MDPCLSKNKLTCNILSPMSCLNWFTLYIHFCLLSRSINNTSSSKKSSFITQHQNKCTIMDVQNRLMETQFCHYHLKVDQFRCVEWSYVLLGKKEFWSNQLHFFLYFCRRLVYQKQLIDACWSMWFLGR